MTRYLYPTLFLLSNVLVLFTLKAQDIKSRSLGEAFWEKDLEVTRESVEFEDSIHSAYVIQIHDVTEKAVRKYWKSYLKDHDAKVRGRAEMRAEGAVLPNIQPEPLDLLTNFSTGSENAIQMRVAFLSDTEEESVSDANIKTYLEGLAIQFNKQVVGHQLQQQSKVLSDLQNDLQDLQKDYAKERRSITRNKKKIEKAKQKLARWEANISAQKSRLEVFSLKEDRTTADAKAMDKINRRIDRWTKQKVDIQQDITLIEAEIQKAEVNLPHLLEEQERLTQEIERQKEMIERYREKKKAVN
jgi:DNA repair exonuclease SbcCD ATPase subunit